MADPEKNTLMSDSMVIAGLTLIGYLGAFFHEYGYLRFFEISPQYIEISFSQIFLTILAVAVICFLVVGMADLLHSFNLFHGGSAFRRSVRISLIYLLFAFGMFMIYGAAWREWIVWVLGMGGMILIEMTSPLLFHRDKKTLEEKFLASEAMSGATAKTSLIGRISDSIGLSITRYFFLAILMLFVSYHTGRAEATNQKNYWVMSATTSTAILREYDHTTLAIHTDTDKNFVPRVEILRDKDIDMTLATNLGPLKKKKAEQPTGPTIPWSKVVIVPKI